MNSSSSPASTERARLRPLCTRKRHKRLTFKGLECQNLSLWMRAIYVKRLYNVWLGPSWIFKEGVGVKNFVFRTAMAC